MLFRSALLMLVLLLPAGAAEARARVADLAVERVRATSAGEVTFTVVNRGTARSRAATVRVEIGTATASVRQRALPARGKARHTARVTGLPPGSWRARVCVRPQGSERRRGNDCASAPGRLTVPAPAFGAPVPATPGETVRNAAPAPTVTADPVPNAAPEEDDPPAVPADPLPDDPPVEDPEPTSTPGTEPTPTATASATPVPTATATASPFPDDPREVASSFQQNPTHDGRIQGTAPAPPLAVAWRKDLGGYPSYPVIAGGRVFAVTDEGELHALDLRNGASLWTRPVGEFNGTLTYDAGRLFVTDGRGLMLAIDVDSGLVLWSRGVSREGPAVAANGKVYLPFAGALDAATGTMVNAVMSSHDVQDTETGPTVDGTRVYYGGRCGAAAFTLQTWTRAWHWESSGSCTGGLAAAVRDGRLYNASEPVFGDDERGYVHDAATGAVLGRFPSGVTPALTDDGAMLIVAGGAVTARDTTTGADRWTFRPDADVGVISPLVSADLAYVRSSAGLHAVDLKTGAERGRVTIDEPAAARRSATASVPTYPGVAAASGTVIVPDGTGLVAVRTASAPPQPGQPEATPAPLDLGPPAPLPGATSNLHVNAAHTGAINLATPAPPLTKRWAIPARARTALIAGGRVFFVDEQASTLRAVDAQTGAALWSTPASRANLAPAHDQGRVFLTYPNGISAHDATTGRVLWQHTWASEAWLSSPPTADNGTVYVNFGGQISAYDGATGTRRWSQYLPGGGRSAVSVDATRVLRGASCATLSRATGAPSGDPEDPECRGSDFAVFPFAHEQLAIQSGTRLMAFDLGRDATVAAAASETPPAILGNIAVTGQDTSLRAYTLPGWTPRWRYDEQARYRVSVPPLIVGRTVYAVNTGGTLRAYDLDTGEKRWSGAVSEYEFGPYADGNQTAMAAGEGLLVVPAQTELVAFGGA